MAEALYISASWRCSALGYIVMCRSGAGVDSAQPCRTIVVAISKRALKRRPNCAVPRTVCYFNVALPGWIVGDSEQGSARMPCAVLIPVT